METPYSLSPASFAVAKQCINDRSARIGVVGLGASGLRLSLLFASSGFAVDGFELDPAGAEAAYTSQLYLQSFAAEQISLGQGRGCFHVSQDLSKLSETEVIIFCVPARFDEEQKPDLQSTREAIFNIASNLHAGHLIVMETVSHPGATEELVVPILESANCSHLKVSHNTGGPNDMFVGISPERSDLGSMTLDQNDVPKVVSGVDRYAADLTADLYGKVFKRIIRVSSTLTAEVAKLLESTYECVNIALVNELKQACLSMGIDPWEVIATAGTSHEGVQAFCPGPGVGGPHIPFDCFSLSRRARKFGVRTKLIELAGEINRDMPRHVVRDISEALNRIGKSIKGSNILVLGLAYERDSNDLYESPSLTIIDLLRRAGAEVDYNDPFVPYIGRANHFDLNMTSASIEDLSPYDAVLIATDHSSYNYAQIVSRAKLVIDTRNATRGMNARNIVLC
jgi:UDP-N-acetyl-D-glucosamine dehydrogenase